MFSLNLRFKKQTKFIKYKLPFKIKKDNFFNVHKKHTSWHSLCLFKRAGLFSQSYHSIVKQLLVGPLFPYSSRPPRSPTTPARRNGYGLRNWHLAARVDVQFKINKILLHCWQQRRVRGFFFPLLHLYKNKY